HGPEANARCAAYAYYLLSNLLHRTSSKATGGVFETGGKQQRRSGTGDGSRRRAIAAYRNSQRDKIDSVHSSEIIIAGGGVAGLSIALELRRRGAHVLLLERGTPGREASSAAAGMLAAADPETPIALRPLALKSARLYPHFVKQLEQDSGINVDFRRTGSIVIGEQHPPIEYRKLSPEELGRLEPGLDSNGHDAFFVEESSVDPE